MRSFLTRALQLDDPEAHPTGAQLAVACVVALAAGGLWGWVMRSPALAVGLFVQLALAAWLTPRARESLRRRVLYSFAFWALFSGMLLLGRIAARS